jgi:tRNA(fMet)-specific endonuclease VapC
MRLKHSDGFEMSGSRYLLDTNAVVALLNGKSNLEQLLSKADWIGVSIISVLEFLVFDGLNEKDIQCFNAFINRVATVDLRGQDAALIQGVISFRQEHHLKLPDAVIAASAMVNDAVLVTADHHFSGIPIPLISPTDS